MEQHCHLVVAMGLTCSISVCQVVYSIPVTVQLTSKCMERFILFSFPFLLFFLTVKKEAFEKVQYHSL